MGKFKVEAPYGPAGDQGKAIEALARGVLQGDAFQTLQGVTGSGKTFSMAKVIEEVQLPTLVISHNKTLAAQLYREFSEFFPGNAVEYFVSYYDYYQPEAYVAARDLYIEKDASINDEIDRLRLKATTNLLERPDVVVVSTVSCIYGLGSPRDYRDMRLRIDCGTPLDIQMIRRKLIELQYDRNDQILQRGKFRHRGDTLEIYPAYLEEAYRIELEWDEVVRIQRIDPLSGTSQEEMETLFLYPAKHFVMPEQEMQGSLGRIRQEMELRFQELLDQGKVAEAERLKTRTEYDLEMMEEMGYCPGIENYSRHLSGRDAGERPATLLDYFPQQFLTLIDESHVTVPQIRGMYAGDRSRKESLVAYGFRLPSALDNRPLVFPEFEALLDRCIFVSATPSREELDRSVRVVEQLIRPTGLLDPVISVRPSQGQIDDLYGEIRQRIEKNQRVLVTTLTKKMSEDLTDYLVNLGLKVRYLHSEIETIERVELLTDLRLGTFDVLVGINLLREGLDLPEVSLVAILDADKIGFLRSATALIQTIGRAARNVEGTVIMYADKRSHAMDQAIGETERRRAVQQAYNEEKGITPASIQKAVQTIIAREKEEKIRDEEKQLEILKGSYNILVPTQRNKLIKLLEKEMLEHAKNLEFEQAALLRDEIEKLRNM
ncbi:excinuclease ABC subunit B [Alkalispirochaeta sphaeroplastigenens]|uniref:UvrABC system protein B n=1 Tax=Alkalispirochaeta sphaeroplastigenens TaxID=1187066 RepID=A0A2S4JGC0_9SPIO|nr:excinuclease ABC subunit UvrB [Alkalispirochaeta sphaeroplastigenens]POQ98582.1 excinuclease ABC subunit B [Alkalispirochaeta sphaeroplastigenens]